jgi:hypothetical protein
MTTAYVTQGDYGLSVIELGPLGALLALLGVFLLIAVACAKGGRSR